MIGALLVGSISFYQYLEKKKWEKDDQLPAHEHIAKENKRIILARLVESVYMMHKEAKTFAAAKRNHVSWMNFNWSKECSDLWSDNYDLVDFDLARLTRVLKPKDQLRVGQELDDCAEDLIHFAVFHRKAGAHELNPEWVVAIRGTVSKRDLLSDLSIFFERLHKTGLVELLLTTVRGLCEDYGTENVTVTGHSLGAAAGLSVTRKLAVNGYALDTHLFNPPFLSMETIAYFFLSATFSAYKVSRKVVTKVKDKIFKLLDEEKYQNSQDEFSALMKWIPHLYVNINDPICYQYAYYFRQYKDKPMSYSLGNLASRLVFHDDDAETFHLIPKAILCLDTTSTECPIEAHKLKNWFALPPPQLSYKIHGQIISVRDTTVD